MGLPAGRLLLLLSHETYRATDFLTAARKLDVSLVIGTDVELAFADREDAGYLTLPFDDVEAAVLRARALHADAPLAGVVAADDGPVVVAAAIAHALGLSGHTVAGARRTRDKLELRRALAAAGLPVPAFAHVQSLADLRDAERGVGFPCVIKPLSANASQGVIRADDEAGLRAAARRVLALLDEPARARGLIVEGFLPGKEVAVEALVVGGELRPLAVFDKPDPLDGPYFEETLYITPSRLPERTQRAVYDAVAAAVRALELRDGPVHAEARVHDGAATIVEVAARTIGGLCGRTLRFGVDTALEELVLRAALGRPPLGLASARKAAGVLMVPIPRRGVLLEVTGVEEARAVPGVWEVTITATAGQELVPLPEGRRYLGFAFASGERPERVEQALRQVRACLGVRMVGDDGGVGR